MSISPINPKGQLLTAQAAGAKVVQATVGKQAVAVQAKPGHAVPSTAMPQPAQAVATPAFQITQAGGASTYLKALWYGPYGVGKTRLATSAVEVDQMNDVFLINAEGGDLTVREAFDTPRSIDQVRVTKFSELARAQEFLLTHCKFRDKKDEESINYLRQLEAWFKQCDVSEIKEPRRYRTVVVDSLTEAEQYLMYQILGVTDLIKLDEDMASAEWAEYKRNNAMMQRLIRAFRDLPMNVMFICAQGYIQDEQKRMNYMPQMTGKLANQVQSFVDIVGFLTSSQTAEGGISRVLWVQPVGRFAAKCRFSNHKVPYFQDPSLQSILTAVGLIPAKKAAQASATTTPAQ